MSGLEITSISFPLIFNEVVVLGFGWEGLGATKACVVGATAAVAATRKRGDEDFTVVIVAGIFCGNEARRRILFVWVCKYSTVLYIPVQ